MMKAYKHIGLIFAAATLFAACEKESLSDTYKDYSGDEIRYVGKCADLTVTPGWERMIVKWENSADKIIKKIKITWALEDVRDSVLLDPGTTEYCIETFANEKLSNGTYEITACGVDASGNTSIPMVTTGRPYTYAHEDIVSFNRLIGKNYFIRDRLVLSFLGWYEKMKKAELVYTKKGETQTKTLVLTPEIVNQLYYMLEDEVDVSKPIVLYRTGELEGCQDIIELEPYTLPVYRTYEADFAQEMKRQFGREVEQLTDEWAESIKTLYLDWSCPSLLDLLHLPNLETLVLGERRYILPGEEDSEYAKSKLDEKRSSDFALEILHKLTGLKVVRYNNHFQELAKTDFIEDRGNTNVQPVISPLDLSGLEFTVVPEDNELFPSGLENLTDGNVLTNWNPLQMFAFETYELTLDLENARTLKGLRLIQKQFRDNPAEIAIAPEKIRVRVSKNGFRWETATYLEDIPVGKSNGEVNYIDFSAAIQAEQWQYVQVQVNSGTYGERYYSALAEITLY